MEEMSSIQYDSRWETVEHGWRAVVLDVKGSTQLTAFVKYVGAPYWRIWAGKMFDTLESAQKWCYEEISTQLHKQDIDEIEKPWHAEPEAWRWLWDTLSKKIGEDDTLKLRNEFAEKVRASQHLP
jgi:hypothetical protein